MKMLTLWACLDPAERPCETPAPKALAWKEAWQQSLGGRDAGGGQTTAGEKSPLRHTGT